MIELIIFLGFMGIVYVGWKIFADHSPETPPEGSITVLPERFVVYDLETTGLDPNTHSIIEIGAIRVNRDSNMHDTFQTLVQPKGRIGKKIVELTGITREMVQADGLPLDQALAEFRAFVGDLPLVAYNAEFDDAFLRAACQQTGSSEFMNEVCCALKMARRAWPYRKSYRLADIARDGGLSDDGTHRALGDCKRALIVYGAAAKELGTYR